MPHFFQAIPLIPCFVYFLVCCACSPEFLYFERQTCNDVLLSSAHIYFPLAFSPANMITTHLVKTDKGMRRGQVTHLQFYKSTSPIHADFSSISSVSQQEVRQAERPAQLFPLPPWSPLLLREQLVVISQLGLSSFQSISGKLAHPPFFHCTLGEAALCSNFLCSFSPSEWVTDAAACV